MSKGKRSLRPLGAGDDYSHLLRFLDDGEKLVKVNAADAGQKLKAETAPDHRCCGQHPLLILVESLEAAADDQPHVFRDIGLIDRDVRTELAGRIEDFPSLDQMAVHFLDEERISLALLEDRAHKTLR